VGALSISVMFGRAVENSAARGLSGSRRDAAHFLTN
jgi:hypothetical protein